MNDSLIALAQIACMTLLVTLLWALTLFIAYWDIQRRKQAGERVNATGWMLVVAFIPFLGLFGYLFARLFSRASTRKGREEAQRGGRRETKLKVQPEIRKALPEEKESSPVENLPMPTILASDYNKETVRGYPNSSQGGGVQPGALSFQFTITSGPDQGRIFQVDRFPAQIGRDLNSAIRLEADDGVSRTHALIYQINGALRIRDLQSRHGTWVNKKPVTDQVLEPGDQIDIGLSSILFECVES